MHLRQDETKNYSTEILRNCFKMTADFLVNNTRDLIYEPEDYSLLLLTFVIAPDISCWYILRGFAALLSWMKDVSLTVK